MWNIKYLFHCTCFIFDFIDITNGRTCSISLTGCMFPNIALNGTNNKAAIIREISGKLYSERNAMSINSLELGYTDAACAITTTQPAKFIVGIDCF